jgi:hypothetical protein
VRQRLHHFDKEKRKAIGEEVDKLLVVGFIHEMNHPDWLANPVMTQTKSKNGGCVLITLA